MRKDGCINGKDAVRIHYRLNRQKGPCLVFLHGATGSSSAFFQQEKFFGNRGYSLLFIDLRGHGKSEKGQGEEFFRIGNSVEDVAKVISQLKIRRFTLIGHCFGSFVAQLFAEKRPKGLTGLVLINSGAKVGRSLPLSAFLKALFALIRLLPVGGVGSYTDYSKHIGTADISLGRICDDLMHCGSETYSRVMREALSFSPPSARHFARPVLILHGRDDSIISLAQASKLKALYGNAEVVVLDTNHIAVINDARHVNESVLEFVRKTC